MGILLLVAGCTPPVRQYEVRDQPLTCDEANRTAYDTLRAMGFRVTAFEPAEPGKAGTLKGTSTEAAGGTRGATVIIECTPTGANALASEDGKWLGQLEFKRAFYLGFSAQLAMAEAQRKRAAQLAASDEGSAPQTGLQVVVEPVTGLGAKLDFDLDLAAGGVLPVKIAIRNATDRAYRIDVDEVRLTRADRERVDAISPDEAARRVTAARVDGQPVTTLADTVIAERLGLKLLTATEVRPGGEVRGFLYFPAGDYTRARVLLTEEESEESEGFVVEF